MLGEGCSGLSLPMSVVQPFGHPLAEPPSMSGASHACDTFPVRVATLTRLGPSGVTSANLASNWMLSLNQISRQRVEKNGMNVIDEVDTLSLVEMRYGAITNMYKPSSYGV